MFDLGAYPAVSQNGNDVIHGEVYAVPEATFIELDALEGYPDFYDRIQVTTSFGLAWMYVVNRSIVDGKCIMSSGLWPEL